MRPQLLKVHLRPEQSFGFRHDIGPYFYNHWHYHEEIELVYILNGSGRQFIGNHIHHFKKGDMILVGSNLPHLWRSEAKYFYPESKTKCEAYVIHFKENCFGENFFNLPENKSIKALLTKAKQGIRIKDPTKSNVLDLMLHLENALNTEKIILLLQILNSISNSKKIKTICNTGVSFNLSSSDSEKLNNIYQYILNNFSRNLSLGEVAAVACLSPNSFCRYFRSKIKKSFSKFLIEVRIGHACKLLAETDKTVSSVCYESGYNNFSNFNRHFKSITSKTPLEHRKHYQENKLPEG